ncbi:hypothetical protein, partial [Anaerotruncus sp. DFI.9.16]|uniref:hypothetical protein n=1 Tax=Anaerotruncus sp. DFI.9.16 TaxID=2965275 RepID=UPI00210B289A
PFLVRTRNGAARRGGTRQLRRSMSGKPKTSATQRNRLAAAFRLSRRLIAAIGARGLRDAKKPLCGGFPLVAPSHRHNQNARSARRKETALRRFLCRETCIYLTKPRDGFRALLTRPVQAVVGVGKN